MAEKAEVKGRENMDSPGTSSKGMEPVSKEQIELLSPRQNGTAVEVDKENPSTKSNRASIIRGMWKKAFKGLKSNKPKEKGDQGNKIEKDSEREKDDKIKVDGSEDKKNSKQTVRQSSLKKMMKRKDSKESQKDSVPGDEIDDLKYSEDIDPVYSLLKCAADLPRSGKPGSTGHGCCSQKTNNDNITLLSNSRSSSPSSDDTTSNTSTCSCPCHTPEVLENYHRPLLSNYRKT